MASGLRLAAVFSLLYLCPAATSRADNAVYTGTLTLGWDASTSTNVANYNVYYGTTSRGYTQTVSAGNTTQATISGLTPGTTYFFAATAVDALGLESDYSSEISFAVPAGGPGQTVPSLTLSRSGTRSVVQWSTNYAGFTLQWSSTLSGTWTSLGSNAPVSGGYFTYTNTTSATRRYYRLKQ
jgi:fibronectin type 3 domain-containing protein